MHTKIDDLAAEQDWIDLQITAARMRCEELSGVATTERTCTLVMDQFPSGRDPIHLPWPPLVEVSSLSYYDENGDAQSYTVGDLQVTGTGSARQCATLYPPVDEDWPSTEAQNPNAVTVTFVCGSDAVDVSPVLKSGMLLDIGSKYMHREDIEMSPSGRAVSLLPESSRNLYALQRAVWSGPELGGW